MLEQCLHPPARIADLDESLAMAEAIVDPRLGIIKSIVNMPQYPGEPRFFQYSAVLSNIDRVLDCATFSALAGGASINEKEAKMRALGEAIERYCSFINFEDEFIYASYDEIGSDALDPTTLPICSEREYANARNYLVKPSRDLKLYWTSGFSLSEARNKKVPANLVYLSHRYRSTLEQINLPISTGLACGASIAEAVQSGICEVVERDALMVTWLHQLPVPKIDLTSIKDENILERLSRLDKAQLEPVVFNITTEIQIPSVMLILISKNRITPVLTVTTATHPDPKRAIAKAIDEGVSTRKYCIGKFREGIASLPNIANPADFIELEDHLLSYIFPEAIDKFSFLLEHSSTIEVKELPNLSSTNPAVTLRNMMKRLDRWDMEVIAADLTTPDIREAGFTVVRVLIPQLQPLSQNHNIRFLGTKRLYEVPLRMGYMTKRRDETEITNLPHPFA